MEDLLTISYVSLGLLAQCFFYPQVVSVLRCVNGASGISLTAWGFWTFEWLVATFYAVFVNGDPYFMFMCILSFVGCGLVFFLALYKRMYYKRLH